MKVKFLVLALAIFFAVQARAQSVLLEYSFTAQTLAPTSTASNLSAGSISATDTTATTSTSNVSPVSSGYSDSYISASGAYNLNTNHWSSGSTNSLQFTVTPNSGYAITLSLLDFAYYTSGTGPTSYSITIGASAPLTGSITQGSAAWNLVSASTSAVISSSTTITVSFAGATGLSGTARIDDLALIGTVAAIPEPANLTLLTAASALGLCLLVRLRRPKPRAPSMHS